MSAQTRPSVSKHPFQYGKVWLFFTYYWVIFGIATYFGQFLPLEWRKPLSIVLLVLILLTMIVQRARFSGPIMSHIYTIVSGLLSYAAFTVALQDLGPSVFFKNVLLAIVGFIIFGMIGFFMIKDASSLGKYLFVTLVALIVASLVGWFIHNPIYHTLISVVGLLLFLLYTLYDFNRMKRGDYSPREMGFNLFLNLFRIIRYVLNLARYVRR
ncbi:Bax inhibitor-1/YccA family protein [Staphylococcus chromogenes]|uniref:Bax inhibitor-1/YccA family protein n=1 Tax=Staphylococcus chromogenes TaxID=46126 RepID=UPI001F170502|nr:Bax inhibitor-1 family protein [Staphylococcus chromogenes]MDT0697153.1 Bax inhibitor-1 family protein [Staphylococcus chromogenes]MDT0739948.1 Bax inhibitor-1 family protein [Staphylococcus chromogenes]MEB7450920.1 Bax inhibitor-1 family protein [Staphylococcus chromogenes]